MAKLSQLLLFDPDPSGLETLTYAFEKDGIAVGAVGDAQKAEELVQHKGSSLLIVALHDPEQGGLDLLRAMSNNPHTRNVACLALGPAKSRDAALQAGAFGYLPSPLFVRDLIDTSKLVAAATLPGSRPSPDTEVSIGLAEIGGVYYLIRALAACARSAAVEILRGARRGELRFIDGNLSSVQLGSLSGMAALNHLLLWEDADLRLKFRGVVRRGGHLSLKNEEVLEQCDRFLRDFAHEVREMGVARTVYRPSDRAVQPTSALPSEVVPLLRLFDGKRDLAQIISESPFRTFDTLRIARQFMNASAVVADPPFAAPSSSEMTAASGPAALDVWFARNALAPAAPARAAVTAAAAAATASDESVGIPTTMVQRPSSPFVKIVGPVGPDGVVAATASGAPTVPLTEPKEPKEGKPRTVTQKEHPLRSSPPATASGTVDADATPKPTRSSSGVARGEIHVTPLTPKKAERTPKPSAPTVMVALEALPTPQPIVSVAPAPLTARAVPSARDLPGPLTPLPVRVTAKPPAPEPVTPRPVAKAAAAAPARVVSTPLPAVSTPLPLAGKPAPVTPAVPAAAAAIKKSGVPGNHRSRTPSNGFSAVEADFFSREADLYKPDSPETFDDLDAGSAAASSPGMSPNKRRPARKG